MTISAPDQFIEDLRQHCLLTPTQLTKVKSELGKVRTTRQLADELVRLEFLTRFQTEQAIEGYAHELNVGRYTLIDVLGEGGMGLVFKARDRQLGRLVALKTIQSEIVEKYPDSLRRFHREAQAVAKLNHPNVVTLYEEGEHPGFHFLAMEYVEGVDLHRMVQQQGALAIPVACEYIRQVAAGLQHAHENGLIHRDIKPSNLLVTRPNPNRLLSNRKSSVGPMNPTPTPASGRPTGLGIVKILDMGLARITEAIDEANTKMSVLTQAGTVIGTPDFISPEQAVDATQVDHRADLYSLGCTFYFLLTGRLPFPDGTSVEKLVKHQRSQPWPLESIRKNVPGELLAVVYRLMQKHPDARYQSAQEVVEALQSIQYTVLGGHSPRDAATPAVVGANGTSAEAPATALLGIDTVVVPARKVAVLQGHTGYVTALAYDPDGKLLASGGLDGVVHLWRVGDDRPLKHATLKNHLGEVQALAFHPRKPYLVTGSSAVMDGHMWRWQWGETEDRKARTLLPGEPFRVDSLAFSADGRRLAASADTMVFFWTDSKRTLERETVIKGHDSPVKAFAFSPDGKRLAMACDDTSVRIWEFGWFRTSQKAVCEGHGGSLTTVAYSPNGKFLATAGQEKIVRLYEASLNGALKPKLELSGHTAPIRLVQFTPRGDLLISVSDGGQVFLWDVNLRTVIREWMIDKSLAYSVAVSRDGRWLATGTNDGQVFLYDLDFLLIEQMPQTKAGL